MSLQYVNENFIPLNQCKTLIPDRNGYREISERQICIMDENKETCIGDSGSPIIRLQNNEFIQVGLISHAVTQSGVCQSQFPQIAVNIQNDEIYSWIMHSLNTNDNQLKKEI